MQGRFTPRFGSKAGKRVNLLAGMAVKLFRPLSWSPSWSPSWSLPVLLVLLVSTAPSVAFLSSDEDSFDDLKVDRAVFLWRLEEFVKTAGSEDGLASSSGLSGHCLWPPQNLEVSHWREEVYVGPVNPQGLVVCGAVHDQATM